MFNDPLASTVLKQLTPLGLYLTLRAKSVLISERALMDANGGLNFAFANNNPK